MNWNAYVLTLSDKGYTPEEIVAEANIPLMTLEYVNAVLYAHKKRYERIYKRVHYRPATEENKRLLAFVESVGKEQFKAMVKQRGFVDLAKELNTTPGHLELFYCKYVRGMAVTKINGNYSSYEQRLIAEGKMKPKPKKVTVEDIKNLW